MPDPLMIVAVLPVAIWAYLLLGRGSFWRIKPFRVDLAPQCANTPRIAVIIPARNEAESIGPVIESWKQQRYEAPLKVFIVDDHSTDATFQIAQHEIGPSERFHLLQAPEKPPDWTGKLWALSTGVEASRDFGPDYLLFTDADIVHVPETLRALLAKAEGGYHMVSLMVRLHCETLAEQALIPAFVFFFLLLYPPTTQTGAAGGCILIRRDALDRIGGIGPIRGELIDDCALATAIKRTGGRIFLAPAEASHSLRIYAGFGDIADMISRTAFNQLRYSYLLLLGTILGLIITYLLPITLIAFSRGAPQLAGAMAWLMMSAAFAPTIRYYRLSLLWALALPAIAAFYAIATIRSALLHWQGRGGLWKGRTAPTN